MKHMGMTIDYARQYLQSEERLGRAQSLLTVEGGPVSYAEAYAGLDALAAEGFRLIPCSCGVYNADGACSGIVQHIR